MKNGDRYIWPVFWMSLGIFLLVIASVLISVGWPFMRALPIFLVALFLAGLTLMILSLRSAMEKKPKAFMILAGAALTGMPVFILLHGIVYGMFIQMFGEGFWGGAANSDEPFFFILAMVGCPLAYLVGVTGSIYLLARSRNKDRQA